LIICCINNLAPKCPRSANQRAGYNGRVTTEEGPTGKGATSPSTAGFAKTQTWGRTISEIGALLALLALLLLLLRGAAGCIASAVVSGLPPSADEAIGKSAADATRAEHGATKASPTPEQVARTERVFDELKKALTPEETRVLVSPRITVLVDPQVNAFALPGGEVFVLTGLLDRTEGDDDMLRGVLAHELGHAVHRHGLKSLVRSGVFGIALAMLLGGSDDVVTKLVAGASQLEQLGYSRSMESDADAFAVDLLKRTGKSPEGLARFLESLEAAPVPQMLSTHPDSKERAKEIRAR